MSGAYTASERLALEAALRDGAPLLCPGCAVELSAQPVERSPEVSYVRRRVWVLCPLCRRTASLDRKD
ncbi:MAG: hypothetical protein KFH98_01815 [Gemmatimonadetes bacterium]|nr:hypothetical protein [Gemmatimonadota bacterium]